jgi:hypothetical protein
MTTQKSKSPASKANIRSANNNPSLHKNRILQTTKLFEQYSKNFSAPIQTPNLFTVFDLSQGAGVSFSSHT